MDEGDKKKLVTPMSVKDKVKHLNKIVSESDLNSSKVRKNDKVSLAIHKVKAKQNEMCLPYLLSLVYSDFLSDLIYLLNAVF